MFDQERPIRSTGDMVSWYYLVRLTTGTMSVLEVKGQDNQEQQTKREFLDEWVCAVNWYGGFGAWAWDVSRHPKDSDLVLRKYASALQPAQA